VAKGAVIADRGPLGGPRVCFVSTRRGNRFLTELLEALGDEAAAAGARVSFAFDGYPPSDGDTSSSQSFRPIAGPNPTSSIARSPCA